MGQGHGAAVRNCAMLLLTGSMDRRNGLWSLAWRRSMAHSRWIGATACGRLHGELDGSSSLDRGSMARRFVAVHSKGYDDQAMVGGGSKDYVHRSKEVMNTTYVI
jgi:hypothetical protein